MTDRGFSRTLHAALNAALGLSLFFVATLVYARLTMLDPFLPFAFRSAIAASGIALLHFLVVLWLWSGAVRLLSILDWAIVILFAGASLCVCWLISRGSTVSEFDDWLRIYVGYNAWWVSLAIAAAVLPLAKASWSGVPSQRWGTTWIAGGSSFCVGLMLYFGAELYSALGMIAKIILILIVPALCLATTTFHYRERRQFLARAIGAIGAALAAAAATIR